MAGKNDIPLYDELVKSPEFSDLDYEEEKDFRLGRREDLGSGYFEMQEHIAFQSILAENYNREYKKRAFFVDDIPLYDEVVKSPEFSELEYEDEKSYELSPRRIELGADPENTQEKVLLDK